MILNQNLFDEIKEQTLQFYGNEYERLVTEGFSPENAVSELRKREYEPTLVEAISILYGVGTEPRNMELQEIAELQSHRSVPDNTLASPPCDPELLPRHY